MPDSLENKRKRLIFRSGHRGTQEMDLILGSFAKAHVPGFNEEDLQLYEDLLQESDPDLYNWYTGKEDVPASCQDNSILQAFLDHKVAMLLSS
ncbi:MAG: succinate dehydrogenase assembly factor 2 [Rhodospirillales bacterium]|nr:succinate dehydrogenase assembly factor 2 [Alphaproteobacteria bacterium]USO03033.1 MAG: succinate dehydrogenase assembly factor 2 [Rhodospirillales bacterium]